MKIGIFSLKRYWFPIWFGYSALKSYLFWYLSRVPLMLYQSLFQGWWDWSVVEFQQYCFNWSGKVCVVIVWDAFLLLELNKRLLLCSCLILSREEKEELSETQLPVWCCLERLCNPSPFPFCKAKEQSRFVLELWHFRVYTLTLVAYAVIKFVIPDQEKNVTLSL